MHWFQLTESTQAWFDNSDPYAPLNWFNTIGAIGCVFWIVAYVLIIIKAQKDKSYGLPLVAICLNFTWEVLAAVFIENPVWLWHIIEAIWMVVDVAILLQLLVYGKNQMMIGGLNRYFYPIVVVCLTLGFIGQYLFKDFFEDPLLFIDAFIINLVMSGLFILLALKRPNGRGLSYGGAWFKWLGTAFTSIQCAVFLPMTMPEREGWAFMWFLYVSIFILDLIYIAILRDQLKADPEMTKGVDPNPCAVEGRPG